MHGKVKNQGGAGGAVNSASGERTNRQLATAVHLLFTRWSCFHPPHVCDAAGCSARGVASTAFPLLVSECNIFRTFPQVGTIILEVWRVKALIGKVRVM